MYLFLDEKGAFFEAGEVSCGTETGCVRNGGPNGNRTRVSGVRGQRPRPLDDGTMTAVDSEE